MLFQRSQWTSWVLYSTDCVDDNLCGSLGGLFRGLLSRLRVLPFCFSLSCGSLRLLLLVLSGAMCHVRATPPGRAKSFQFDMAVAARWRIDDSIENRHIFNSWIIINGLLPSLDFLAGAGAHGRRRGKLTPKSWRQFPREFLNLIKKLVFEDTIAVQSRW